MIQIAGMVFQPSQYSPTNPTEQIILERLQADRSWHTYPSIGALTFEIRLRTNIIASAKALYESDAAFEVFASTRANPMYWFVTSTGAIQLKEGVHPSSAIRDIFLNGSQYGFECATAMIIIFYDGVLRTIGDNLFNTHFQHLVLYSWNFDPDLGLTTAYTNYFIPGDVVYFENPDFHPQMSQWRGENAVVLENDKYFGHGVGMQSAQNMIATLNELRKPNATHSAYLSDIVARPNFVQLALLSGQRQQHNRTKLIYIIITHNESSISLEQYIYYLHNEYHRWRDPM
ncbi:protein-glutamine gamma-glutamyltransferase [Alteribacillus persepolensis]|uniref:Protein-glutamine gamma-glutamyltransferase n=1 Tax=Alteribacillus persepolensis TaxID=568899 RepID=A0A1G7Z364_9BACI|nr:protein-glutamine gamma-glutamyltransferase [Alteribacillus persepolensis]SDH03168.1 protein-glutamine gamma-glutamyltransferase [Alteribacillus persepolensis]